MDSAPFRDTNRASDAPHEFTRQVHTALVHLHDATYLEAHPLARRLARLESSADPGAAVESADRILRRRLEEAIAVLEGSESSLSDAGRAGRLLRLRFVEGMEPKVVQRELAISRAQFYRDRTHALNSLVQLLVHKWPPEYFQPAAEEAHGAGRLRAVSTSPVGEQGRQMTRGSDCVESRWSAVSDGVQMQLDVWSPFILLSASWAFAWFVTWSFAQTTGWLAGWAVGGAVSGLAIGAILRRAGSLLSWTSARVLTLGWVAGWTTAWLLGWGIAELLNWTVRPDLLARVDPNNIAYLTARVACWMGSGLLTGRVVSAAGPVSGRAVAAWVGIGWAAAAASGHSVFWALAPVMHAHGTRFAVSGLAEGVIGGSVTLWQLHRVRRAEGPPEHLPVIV